MERVDRVLYVTLLVTVFIDLPFASSQLKAPVEQKLPDFDGMRLQHIHVLFRHGDRTPIDDVVNTRVSFESLWPSGRGQLTEKGIIQEFDLGRWLRSRYDAFIPALYNGSDFHMRSTDLDRTLMSAQSVSAGLYRNVSSPLEPYGLPWIPIPVHTVSQEADVLLSTAPCPCLDLLRKLQMNSAAGTAFEQKHRKLFDLLEDKLKTKIDRFNIWKVSDTLICMKAHNVSFPEWCTDDIFLEIIEVDTFYWNLEYAGNREIIRLEIGVFLNAMVEHINSVVKGLKSPTIRKHSLSVQHTLAYSAHDTDVVYLLSAFGAYDAKLVPYSGTVVVELLGPNPPATFSDYRLRLLYKRGYADLQGEYLRFAPCSNQSGLDGCRLDLVWNYIHSLLMAPDDFDSQCALNSAKLSREGRPSPCSSNSTVDYYLYLLIAFAILVSLVIMTLSIFVCRVYCQKSDPAFTHLVTSMG